MRLHISNVRRLRANVVVGGEITFTAMVIQLQLLKYGSYCTSFIDDTRQRGVMVSDTFHLPATHCITRILLHHRQLVRVLTIVAADWTAFDDSHPRTLLGAVFARAETHPLLETKLTHTSSLSVDRISALQCCRTQVDVVALVVIVSIMRRNCKMEGGVHGIPSICRPCNFGHHGFSQEQSTVCARNFRTWLQMNFWQIQWRARRQAKSPLKALKSLRIRRYLSEVELHAVFLHLTVDVRNHVEIWFHSFCPSNCKARKSVVLLREITKTIVPRTSDLLHATWKGKKRYIPVQGLKERRRSESKQKL